MKEAGIDQNASFVGCASSDSFFQEPTPSSSSTGQRCADENGLPSIMLLQLREARRGIQQASNRSVSVEKLFVAWAEEMVERQLVHRIPHRNMARLNRPIAAAMFPKPLHFKATCRLSNLETAMRTALNTANEEFGLNLAVRERL